MNFIGNFVLKHFAVFLVLLISSLSHPDFYCYIILIATAVIFDYARQKLLPELQLSTDQLRKLLIESSLDDLMQKKYKQKLRCPTGLIYILWFPGIILIIISNGILPHSVIWAIVILPNHLYQFSQIDLLTQAFLIPSRAHLAWVTYSFSWDIFFLGTASEISGGAFYFVNSNAIRNKSLWKNDSAARQVLTVFVISILIFAFLYFGPAVTEGSNIIGYYANPQPDTKFVFYLVLLATAAMLQAAGQGVRFLYVVLIYMKSGDF